MAETISNITKKETPFSKFNPKWAGLGLYFISLIPGKAGLGDIYDDVTIGEVLAHSIVAGAKKDGGESILLMDAAITHLEEFTTDDPLLADRVLKMNFFGSELRETLGFALIKKI